MSRVAGTNPHKSMNACIVASFLLFALIAPAGAQSTPFPMPEDFLPSNDGGGYITKASEFLSRNPTSKYAPRVALDILMVANLSSNAPLVEQMKACLLFDHIHSPQGLHIASGFKEAKDFSKFIANEADGRLAKEPWPLPEQFTRLVAFGLQKFGYQLLEDSWFLVQAHCLADASGSVQAVETIAPILRERCLKDEKLDRVVKIVLDKDSSLLQKAVLLHKEKCDSNFLERFYLSRISDSEKKQPEIVKILIENAVNSQDYTIALEMLESIADTVMQDPQMLFWQAWVCYSLGQDERALTSLEQVVTRFPNSEWAPAAEQYANGVRHFNESFGANVDELLLVFQRFKSGFEVLETEVEFVIQNSDECEQVITAYLGMVPEENRIEFCLAKKNNMIFGYRVTASDSAIFMENEPKILVYTSPGVIPVPALSISRNEDGRFAFNGSASLGGSMEQLGSTSSSLLESPFLSTKVGGTQLLSYTTRKIGWVPTQPIRDQNGISFVWQVPSTDSPELKECRYHVSSNHEITTIGYEESRIKSLKYGAASTVELNPPKWPDRPIDDRGEFEFVAIMKVFAYLVEHTYSK